jgi:hypothetical protein
MAAGHIVNGVCVDVAASTDAYYSQLPPVASAGSPVYQTQATKDVSTWYLNTTQDGLPFSSFELVPPVFASCDTTETFFDGLVLGWGVAGAMVAAYAVHLLRRGIL